MEQPAYIYDFREYSSTWVVLTTINYDFFTSFLFINMKEDFILWMQGMFFFKLSQNWAK